MNETSRIGTDFAAVAAAHFPLPTDSLALAQVALTLSVELGFHVPLRLLLDARSPQALVDSLQRLAATHPAPPSRSRALPERSRRRRRRLSFAQERMCFMRAMSGDSTAYHVTAAVRLRGELDRTALADAVSHLPGAFPMLRTRFVPSSDGAEPVVENMRRLQLQISEGEELQAWVARICKPGFDLESGNTMRAALLGVDPRQHVLLLVLDHSIVDLHSIEMLLQTLADRYRYLCGSRGQAVAPALENYSRYTDWHRRWFREYQFAASREYWLRRLDQVERVTLAPDYSRPVVPSFHGRRFGLELTEERWRALEQLAFSGDSTLTMLLYAALALAMANRTGSRDLAIGVPFACRHHQGAAQCFGPLINTLAVRIAVDYRISFRRFLQSVRQEFLDAFDHQDMPFEVVVDQLHLSRQPGLSPLFGVMLNMLNTRPAVMDMPALDVDRLEVDRGGAQFDLTLTVDRTHTRTIWFEYATDLYRLETIAAFAELLDGILQHIQTDADRLLLDLPYRLALESVAIAAWSTGPPAVNTPDTFELFRRNVGRSPAKPAIVCGQKVIAYGQALDRAMRLAGALQSAAVGTNQRVGLLLERSVDLPVVLLASLCSGVTFVPLDPGFPDERLAHIARDAELGLFIVDDAEYAREPWMPANAVIIALDQVFETPLCPATQPATDPQRPAYILYTSGSTGQPKGVQVGAGALAGFLTAMVDSPGISADDRLLAVTTLNFDISLLELLLPLIVGATVVVANRTDARDPHRLAAMLVQHSISMLQGTPSMWWQLLEARWEGRRALRALVGGESLSPDLAAKLLPRVGGLWNLYGPTETTIWSTCTRVTDPDRITVGRPIRGTTVEIVDGLDRPCGIGAGGEIVIGGLGLAQGYLNLPEQTASRFPCLPGVNGGRRVYRTGDLGRWSEGGEIQVLGRADRQIKLRGHRIELQEIEMAAQSVTGVTRAVAAVQQRSFPEARLVLFYTCTKGEDPGDAAVKAKLRSLLPDYMIPQITRAIDAFPLLPNGKTDVDTLLRLPEEGTAKADGRKPATDDERSMAAIWRELLDLPDVDCDQDFFSLGGHSLLAMRLVSRIRDEMQRKCTLALLFENPTISALCDALEQSPAWLADALVPLQVEGRGTPLYCICGVQIYRRLVTELDLDAPVYAIYMQASDDSVSALAQRYLDAIRATQPHGPYQLLGFSLGGVLAYEIAQQLAIAGEAVEQLVILDSDVPGQSRLGWLRSRWRRLRGSEAMPDYLRLIREHDALPYAGKAVYVKAALGDHFSPGFEWRDLIADLKTGRINCKHLDLLAPPHVKEVAALLSPALQPASILAAAGRDQELR
jgi:amino acid adenylation domain-containing protein